MEIIQGLKPFILDKRNTAFIPDFVLLGHNHNGSPVIPTYMYGIRNKLSWFIFDYYLVLKGIFHVHIGVDTGITLMGTASFSMDMIDQGMEIGF